MSSTNPIVIDSSDDDDDCYVLPKRRLRTLDADQTGRCHVRLLASSPVKVEPQSDGFMGSAEATSGPRKSQSQIPRFFSSPGGRGPAYQPTVCSFLLSGPTVTQVVLPEFDAEPLASLPDPFIYRTPSLEPLESCPSSGPAMNGEAAKPAALKRSCTDVDTPPPTKFTVVRSSPKTNRGRIRAAGAPVRRESPSLGKQTEPAAENTPSIPPQQKPHRAPPIKPMVHGKAPSCEGCKAATSSTIAKPVGDGSLCNACTSEGTKSPSVGERWWALATKVQRQDFVSAVAAVDTMPDDGSIESPFLETTPIHRGVRALITKMKPYTPESMNGGVQDLQETSEGERKRRKSEAEYRARQKKADPAVAEATTATTPEARPLCKSAIGGPKRCQFHSDPDCSDEACISDFFEEYDPLDDPILVRSVLKARKTGDTSQSLSQHAISEEDEVEEPVVDDPACGERMCEAELALSLVARDGRRRRPYLSEKARGFLRHMGGWPAFSDYVDCIIHVDFTPAEAEALRLQLSEGQRAFNGVPIDQQIGFHAFDAVDLDEAHRFLQPLPGRTASDVVAFIEECKAAFLNGTSSSLGQSAIRIPREWNRTSFSRRYVPKSALRFLRESGRGLANRGGLREPFRALELRIRDTMPAWKAFTEGSSDVSDICWSPDGRRFGLSCCTLNDEYNRAGNIMLGLLGPMKVCMLDGHKVPRPDPQHDGVLDPFLYSTVSSVRFSRDGQLLFSGSYDETVKVWLGEDGALLESIDLGSRVSHLATSPIHHQLVAAGCGDGSVSVLPIDPNGNLQSDLLVFKPAKPSLEAAVLAWCNELKPNWLIAGYDNRLAKRNSGDLLIFDVQAQKVAANVVPGCTRQFDVFFDERGSTFATAAAAGGHRSSRAIKTQVRLYSLASDAGQSTRAILEFDSEQHDINKVTTSPDQFYVTASGTDGSTAVWDRRNPDYALHVLKHGPSLAAPRADGDLEIEDSGIMCALWGPSSDRFYTGSSDGVVKIWDVRRGDPFVADFASVDSQIMAGAFSPLHDMLLIGECSGKATLFSTRGDKGAVPQLFEVDMSQLKDEQQAEETGVEAARALLESGKMVVEGQFAWATGR